MTNSKPSKCKTRSAFEDLAAAEFEQVFKRIIEEIEGKPLKRDWEWPKSKQFAFEVLEDFEYVHTAQDCNRGTYKFKRGDIFRLSSLEDEYFMPDRSKLKFIGEG